MRPCIAFLCVVVAQGYRLQSASAGYQGARAETILQQAATVIRRAEPAWQFTSRVCDCEPVLDEIEASSGWWDARGNRRVVVLLHVSKSVDSASRSMKPRQDRLLRIPGWTFAPYQFADAAYIGTYRNGERFDLAFRKGRLIVFMGSESKTDIERFAKYLLAAISEAQ